MMGCDFGWPWRYPPRRVEITTRRWAGFSLWKVFVWWLGCRRHGMPGLCVCGESCSVTPSRHRDDCAKGTDLNKEAKKRHAKGHTEQSTSKAGQWQRRGGDSGYRAHAAPSLSTRAHAHTSTGCEAHR
eukprot:3072572-Rhodomonas_salina.1